MTYAIGLPNGRRCSIIPSYIASWRALIAMDGGAEVRGWDWHSTPARDILRRLRGDLNERINRHLPAYGQGRKWDRQWQIDCRRDARIVNEYAAHRIAHPVNRLSTPELQARFQWAYSSLDGVSVRLYSRR